MREGKEEGCVGREDEKWRGVRAGEEEVGMDSGRNGEDSGDAV